MGRFHYADPNGYALGNKGFIGRSVPPPAPLAGQTLTIGGPSSTGPWLSSGTLLGGYQDGNTNGGFGAGAVNPDPFFFGGLLIDLAAFTDRILGNLGDPAGFTVGAFGVNPQNAFTKIVLGPPLNLTFLTAAVTAYSAAYVSPNTFTYTQWGWASAFNITPFLTQTIPVTVS